MRIPVIDAGQLPAGAYLLDVREPDEWSAGHAPDAVHLPMMEVPVRLAEIPRDGDVVVVCRSGGRSGQVVAYLQQQGYDNVVNLDGGMLDWAAGGRPMVSEDGQPARVL
ncbi:rhodanese-related sulfurtransferase [Hamadaea flava]|uniref:Rhodanese-like domain-containing protein n=1 Tax=Hamadaea flava TaxID=1742688 RepID=A0ABV8LFU7_9ACTN|nr:rhodanese-like domain-containing protein [Hamadaea flava]MCP2325922.1 rhodanese-related sulfurtransferase [Hamadaea flava]